MSKKRFSWFAVFFAFMLGFAIAPNTSEAKPVAGVGDPTEAFIILGDDKVEFCPDGSYLALGRDVAGVNYYGCWRFKPGDEGVVQIVWAQAPGELLELPTNLFEKIPPEMSL